MATATNIIANSANFVDVGDYTAATTTWPSWNVAYIVQSNGVYVVQGNGVTTIPYTAVTGASATIWCTWNVRYVDGGLAVMPVEPAQADAAKVRRQSAEAKADKLLKYVLDAGQRQRYERDREFEVVVGKTGKTVRYLLKHGWAGNVYRLNAAGVAVERLCIHPITEVPIADNLVAQKLLLESNETEFRRIANITKLAA